MLLDIKQIVLKRMDVVLKESLSELDDCMKNYCVRSNEGTNNNINKVD